ncbi:unnamed protein product [Ranitomeya imitator]|uniref:EF-hand domain-containing protein n=1 Tax=Ranitomeya imitator TaxID=111125 RepID=A0ABN9LZR0_9NEOB|nr:unnamed protein product [Ranitomeya imitator]
MRLRMSASKQRITVYGNALTQKDAGTVDKIMKELDENGDGEVDFQEFVILVASLTVACNTFFCESS